MVTPVTDKYHLESIATLVSLPETWYTDYNLMAFSLFKTIDSLGVHPNLFSNPAGQS